MVWNQCLISFETIANTKALIPPDPIRLAFLIFVAQADIPVAHDTQQNEWLSPFQLQRAADIMSTQGGEYPQNTLV